MMPCPYTQKSFEKMRDWTINTKENRNTITRNFEHEIYKTAVNKEIKKILLGISHARLASGTMGCGIAQDIVKENISISFPRKGPTYGNAARHKMAYHYDDSFVSGVMAFKLPNSKGAGINLFKNIKLRLGMGNPSRVISRLLGRVSILRKLFKPMYVPYAEGHITFFFADISLHGVEDCYDGDRLTLTLNMSRVCLDKFKNRYK